MRFWALACFFVGLLSAQDPPRVFLISLDGFGYEAFTKDPAASSMSYMQRMAREGLIAPLQAAFPSLTAAGHASLFTGAYGDRNGVTANQVSRRPRDKFFFDERVNGFRAEQLDRENFWLELGRRGVRTVAHNSTQGFPCTANNSGPNVALMNSYQTAEVTPDRVLRGKDVEWLSSPAAGFSFPKNSRKPILYFRYKLRNVRLAGAVYAQSRRYDTLRLSQEGSPAFVDAGLRQVEDEPFDAAGKPRPLARFFSESLGLSDSAGLFFRLFELQEDGRDFLLYQSPAKEISLCVNGQKQDAATASKLLQTAGAFVGNGAGGAYSRGDFGAPLTDGRAERRLLETLELHARQTMRHTDFLLRLFSPRFLVDYISTPDDMLHLWWGWTAQGEPFLDPFREWGYQIIDWRVGQLLRQRREQDHVIVVSDHGMTSITHELRVNRLLADWGYRDRVYYSYYGLFVNTKDWKNGLVEPSEARKLLEEVRGKLAAYTFAGKKVFREFFWPEEIASRYGVGGDRAANLYFDLEPGWSATSASTGPPAQKLDKPRGEHGPLPTRFDLLALYLHYGPALHTRPASLKTKDIAGIVRSLLE